MKYGLLFLLVLSCFSCSKIQPEKNDTDTNRQASGATQGSVYHTWSESCWVHSCNMEKYLIGKYERKELNLPNLDSYKKRFQVLLDMHPDKNELIQSQNFRILVSDMNKDFFWCSWNIYECRWTEPYGYDETNFLFYLFIPDMVIEAYVLGKWWNESDAETIIQAIKRKDFVSYEEKEKRIWEYKANVESLRKKMDLSKIDKERLKSDPRYFQEIILDPIHWVHDNIIKEIPSVKIDWEEWDQIDRIAKFTIDEFYTAIGSLWITKEEFVENVKKIHWIENPDINRWIMEKLRERTSSMLKKYGIAYQIPLDRYYRNDELYVFSKGNIGAFPKTLNNADQEDFEADALYIRHLVLLLFNLWADERFYELTNRLQAEGFEEKFALTNLFKYSKYLKYENIYTKY